MLVLRRRHTGRCTEAAPVAGEKRGGPLGGLDFDQGGHRFLADRVSPLSILNPACAQQLATSSGYTKLRAVLSGVNEPQFPTFPAKRGSATSPALKIGSSQEFYGRGLVSKQGDPSLKTDPHFAS